MSDHIPEGMKLNLSLSQGCKLVIISLSMLILLPYLLLLHTHLEVETHLNRQIYLSTNQTPSDPFLALRSTTTRTMLQKIPLKNYHNPMADLRNKLSDPIKQSALLRNNLGPHKKRPDNIIPGYKSTRRSTNGFLAGNVSSLIFKSYGKEVDLRIIVLAYDRATSLQKCLNSLNTVDFANATVMLHIWIDRNNETNLVHGVTYNVAQAFEFAHGTKSVHVHASHVGILNQWVNVWRPRGGTQEVALILEDDMTVSKYIWQWLKPAHDAYRRRSDISGFGLSHPGMEHVHATYLDIPARYTVYLYRVICTWGFSPHPTSWRHFQDWFFHSEQNATFLPLVDGILPSRWFLGELSKGQERNLWEMWHIYFTHNSHPPQYTAMLNTAQEGLLAVNRHEVGLHDRGRAKTETLCETWKSWYGEFPQHPPKFGYNGKIENSEEIRQFGVPSDKNQLTGQ